jgi:hypothetical protein
MRWEGGVTLAEEAAAAAATAHSSIHSPSLRLTQLRVVLIAGLALATVDA